MKVVIDVASGRLAIEGDGPELLKVLEAARALAPSVKQIQIITSTELSGNEGSEGDEQGPAQSTIAAQGHGPKTLRQFARSLSLNNAPERIAAIAYYINKIENRPSFSPKELDGWFTMCGFQKPSQMPVALFDTKRKYGYADNIGRGMWRISTQGENLITAKLNEAGT
ncbi:MAG TPA: hypothetical protein VNH11_13735 [Pirellulales bacterium]|nr:hypothetical protein [Pirellulales bacterium]